MAEFDNPDLSKESSQEPEAAPEAPPVEGQIEAPEAPPETIPYRLRDGTEIPLPASALQQIADSIPEFGGNAAAVLNKMRLGDESDWMLRQAKDYYKRSRQPRTDAEYQGIETQRQRQYQPQYQRPQYQPQPQYQQQDPDDPIQMLRATNQQVQELRELFVAQAQAQHEQQQAAWQKQFKTINRETEREYASFASKLKKEGWDESRIPDKDVLLEEALDTFGDEHAGEMSAAELYDKIHRLMDPQGYIDAALRQNAARARDPKAKVPVPAARPAAPSPPQKGGSLDGVSNADIIAMLKESARRV